MAMGNKRFRPSRRLFLQGAGGGLLLAASGMARPLQATATAAETYQLENGFISLSGAYGKLTRFACDPAGSGQHQPTSFGSVFLGTTDFFDAGFNKDVTWTATGTSLSLAGIQLPSIKSLKQAQTNSPVPLNAGHTIGQSFTASMYRFTRVGGQFPTWSSNNAALRMTLFAGTLATGLTEIATREVNPLQDNGWAYLDVPDQPAGSYYLEISHTAGTPGWWSQLGAATVDVGGSAYLDRQVQADRSMTIDVAGFNVDGIASWKLDLSGRNLAMAYDIQWKTDPRADPGLTLTTSWRRDGYSVAAADGVLFNRFYGDQGIYMPSEQLKRRDAWTNPVSGSKAVTAGRQRPVRPAVHRQRTGPRRHDDRPVDGDVAQHRHRGRGADHRAIARGGGPTAFGRAAGGLPGVHGLRSAQGVSGVLVLLGACVQLSLQRARDGLGRLERAHPGLDRDGRPRSTGRLPVEHQAGSQRVRLVLAELGGLAVPRSEAVRRPALHLQRDVHPRRLAVLLVDR